VFSKKSVDITSFHKAYLNLYMLLEAQHPKMITPLPVLGSIYSPQPNAHLSAHKDKPAFQKGAGNLPGM
jgi:hypothetical protein